MANAFRNYVDLSGALEQANDTKNASLQKLEETKEKASLTGKTIGELKSAITGRSAGQKIWKDIIKPKVKAKLDKIAKEKLDQLQNKFKGGTADRTGTTTSVNESSTTEPTGGEDSGSGGVENEPTTTADLGDGDEPPPAYEDNFESSTQSAEDRFNDLFGDSSEARGSAMSDEQAQGVMSRGLQRVSNFENRVKSGEAEGDETTAFANQGDGITSEWRTQKTDFTDEDMGDSVPGNETYNRANGLTDDETSDLKNWFSSRNDATGPDEIDNLEQNFNYRGGNFSNTITKMRYNNQTPTQPSSSSSSVSEPSAPDPTTDTPDAPDIPKTNAESLLKKGGKKLGEDDAIEEGATDGAEAATGVLDSIPGLDILGMIGGAILAGVEGHKQHEDQKLEQNQSNQSSAITFVDQSGVGNE